MRPGHWLHHKLSKRSIMKIIDPHSRARWKQLLAEVVPLLGRLRGQFLTFIPQPSDPPRLDRGWIIANHKLVSFHAAFLTSLLSIPPHVATRFNVLREMFLSVVVVISSLVWSTAWHYHIA